MRMIASLTTVAASVFLLASCASDSSARRPADSKSQETSFGENCADAYARNLTPPPGCPDRTNGQRQRRGGPGGQLPSLGNDPLGGLPTQPGNVLGR